MDEKEPHVSQPTKEELDKMTDDEFGELMNALSRQRGSKTAPYYRTKRESV